jgi:predicted SprT family Zn-dependent metalloprotease
MRDLRKYAAECIAELESFDIDTSSIPADLDWKVSRAKKRYGQCKSRNGVPFEINISSFMLDENVLKDDLHLRNTIIHELLHALTPGAHHGGEWKRLANKVNIKSGGKYHIARCSSDENMGIDMKEKPVKIKYILRCTGCGIKQEYLKKSKVIQHPEWYRCSKCKSDFEVINL